MWEEIRPDGEFLERRTGARMPWQPWAAIAKPAFCGRARSKSKGFGSEGEFTSPQRGQKFARTANFWKEDPGQGCPGRTAFAEQRAAKERAWERRRIYFAAAWEEIRPDGEFLEGR
ncbi:MAG: hypothetical protein O7G84_16345 [Gammaproteobacteria bacterium]|nr:hypothetical protein [Gammaproteobacteria bacterium]